MSIKDFADEPFPRGLTAQEWMDWCPWAIERIANADVNAARNILAAGLAVAGRGGTPELVGPMKRQLEVGAAA